MFNKFFEPMKAGKLEINKVNKLEN